MENKDKVVTEEVPFSPSAWKAEAKKVFYELATQTEILTTGYLGKYKITDISEYLANPQGYWHNLLEISEYLMRTSPHYYRLNTLYSNMAVFNWWLKIIATDKANSDTVAENFKKLANKLESMELKHEFGKIMRVLPYQDVYFGLVVEGRNSFFFQQIRHHVCEIFQVEDGIYKFKINLLAINPAYITAYPDYVREAYVQFRDGVGDQWYIPPSDKQICLKMNDQWVEPYPVLLQLLNDILDLDTYKKLKLQSARTDNYKAIAIQVPLRKDTVDTPLLSPAFLEGATYLNRELIDDNIGMFYTFGSEAVPVSFKDSMNTRNNVSDAVDEIYNDSGITKELFNGSSSATAVTFSIENTSAFIYNVYRQMERWVNRWIKKKTSFSNTKYGFSFYMLDMTIFNKDVVIRRYKDSSTLGVSVEDYMCSLGITPATAFGRNITRDIFDFRTNLIPLISSYNSPGSLQAESQGGRPTNDEAGIAISDDGESSQDRDTNADR